MRTFAVKNTTASNVTHRCFCVWPSSASVRCSSVLAWPSVPLVATVSCPKLAKRRLPPHFPASPSLRIRAILPLHLRWMATAASSSVLLMPQHRSSPLAWPCCRTQRTTLCAPRREMRAPPPVPHRTHGRLPLCAALALRSSLSSMVGVAPDPQSQWRQMVRTSTADRFSQTSGLASGASHQKRGAAAVLRAAPVPAPTAAAPAATRCASTRSVRTCPSAPHDTMVIKMLLAGALCWVDMHTQVYFWSIPTVPMVALPGTRVR